MKKNFILLAALGVFALSSCNQKTTTTNNAPANNPPQVNTPSDAYGVLGVVRVLASYSTPSVPGVSSMDLDYKMGVAFAGFSTTTGSATFDDAGNVSVNDSALTKLSNNYYGFTPKGAPNGSDMGISTSSYTYNWNITGSSSVSAFTYTASGYLPGIGKINSSKEINTSSSYTVTLQTAPSNYDSVIWVMAGPSGSVSHITGPGVTSYTFTAAEVGSLGKGENSGLVQVAPYRITPFTKNGKKYYYIHESCATMFGNLN